MATPLHAVQVHMLGGFQVDVRGRTLNADAWPRKTARQVFKCLLTHSQRRVSKDEAIELLWPDGDPATGAANLRSTLTALRKALEPIEIIVTDRESIAIRNDVDLWTDVNAFEDALRRAGTAFNPLPLFDAANALYRGDYLPDDMYEDWATGCREELRRAWTELQFTLARLHDESDEVQGALVPLQRLLRADACNEPAAQTAMKLPARQGRRPEGLRVYRRRTQSCAVALPLPPPPRT